MTVHADCSYNRRMSSRKKRKRDEAHRKPPSAASAAGEDGGVRLPPLFAALALVCAGYFFLGKTDPAGKNIYAVLSPLFLLAGYLLVPAALLPFKRSEQDR